MRHQGHYNIRVVAEEPNAGVGIQMGSQALIIGEVTAKICCRAGCGSVAEAREIDRRYNEELGRRVRQPRLLKWWRLRAAWSWLKQTT